MTTPATRVDNAALRQKVADASASLDAVYVLLADLMVVLNADDRQSMPRTRAQFPEAARTLADVLARRPDITALTAYDAAAVVEDLDNVEVIAPLIPRLEALLQMAQDSRLQWLAEAQEPTLAAYTVAKTLAKRDGSLASLIAPLAQVLSRSRVPVATSEESEP